jgi:hypothetical protein
VAGTRLYLPWPRRSKDKGHLGRSPGIDRGRPGPGGSTGRPREPTHSHDRTIPGTPEGASGRSNRAEGLGTLRDERTHRPVSAATPGSLGVAPDDSDDGGTPGGCRGGPDKTPACLTGAGQAEGRRPPCKGRVHTS